MKFAFFVRPHLGGTYTLFRHLRAGLAPFGVDVQWVGVREAGEKPDAQDSHSGFSIPCDRNGGEAFAAAVLLDALEERGFDGVFVNVLTDRLQMNIVRYLPPSLLRIMIVHNITPGTYAAAKSIRDHVHATIGVNERCRSDLVRYHKFLPDRTVTIPNAVDTRAFAKMERAARPANELRLLFLGRVEDASKGVFWLPPIMESLPENISLTIAGDGPDLPRLKQRMGARARFLGDVAPEAVPGLLTTHDALIMPSRYEGLSFTLVEAMAAGCVPVVSRIAGVTDNILEQDKSGLLFPVGDWREAARLVKRLASRPGLLEHLSAGARALAAQGFDREAMAKAYLQLIEKLRAMRPDLAPTLPLESWSLPSGMRSGLRTYLPQPMKNWLRVVKERI